MFKAYADNFLIDHRALFERVVDALMPERLIIADQLPKTATATLTKTKEHTVLHIKTTYAEHKMNRGIIEEHTYAKSVPVSVKGEYREAYVLPEMTKINSRIENGRTFFETGDILGYRAFLLEE